MRNLLLVSTTVIILSIFSFAQIHISGAQSGILVDTTYIVEGDIWVEVEDSLTIEPGAVFLFNGDFDFDIYGYLSAVGTEDDNIFFEPNTGVAGWGGLDFYDSSSDSNIIVYCKITGSIASGIYCDNSSPAIENCLISDNVAEDYGGGICCSFSEASITNCTISDNTTDWNGGGFYFYNSDVSLINCEISGNSAFFAGGGWCEQSAPLILHCDFTENTATWDGGALLIGFDSSPTVSACSFSRNSAWRGGGIWCHKSNSTIKKCVISENSADCGGGFFCYWDSETIIENCTVSGNSAEADGGGIHCNYSSTVIVNTIVEGNYGNGGIYFDDYADTEVIYGDFYDNQNGNFAGNNIPPNLGLIVAVNANGDSCDVFYNIFLDPLFIDPAGGDYHLQASSPCIDAGDPASPLDPDSTIADMGAFYFDQSAAAQLNVTLTPHNPPIQIPAVGGIFQFDVLIENAGSSTVNFDAWIMAQLPDSTLFGPVLQRLNLAIPAGGTIIREDLIQVVPAGAPSGDFSYIAYVGGYPDIIFAATSFNFEKLAGSDAPDH